MRGRRTDEWLHDHQQVHGELVFFSGYFVLASSGSCREQGEQLPESIEGGERVQAIVMTEVCGDGLGKLSRLCTL